MWYEFRFDLDESSRKRLAAFESDVLERSFGAPWIVSRTKGYPVHFLDLNEGGAHQDLIADHGGQPYAGHETPVGDPYRNLD